MPLHLFLDTDFTDRERENTKKKKKKNVTVKVKLANTPLLFLHALAKVMWVYTSLGGCPLKCEPKQLKWMGGWGWWWWRGLAKSVWSEDGTKTGSYLISLCRGMRMKALATGSAAYTVSYIWHHPWGTACTQTGVGVHVHFSPCLHVSVCVCASVYTGESKCLLVAACVCVCACPVSELWSSLVVSLC